MLSILISLCENGVNPESLAVVVKELKTEAEAVQVGLSQTRMRSMPVATIRHHLSYFLLN